MFTINYKKNVGQGHEQGQAQDMRRVEKDFIKNPMLKKNSKATRDTEFTRDIL